MWVLRTGTEIDRQAAHSPSPLSASWSFDKSWFSWSTELANMSKANKRIYAILNYTCLCYKNYTYMCMYAVCTGQYSTFFTYWIIVKFLFIAILPKHVCVCVHCANIGLQIYWVNGLSNWILSSLCGIIFLKILACLWTGIYVKYK